MSESSSATVYPCPFSKGYGIPAEQAWILLKVFLVYRFLLASLFLILFYGRIGPSLLGSYDSELYILSSQIYFLLTVLSGICILWRLTSYASQAQILIFTDIVTLTVIMHACGGIGSGMGILLAVSIASGGLMIGGRCAMLFASLGSLVILTEHVYSDYNGVLETTSYTYTGMMGAAYLAIALVSHIFAKRSEQILQLADQQKQTIFNLEELNQYIIHHLQSGIIIINQNQSIQMANEASLRLVNLTSVPGHLREISIPLSSAFQNWLRDPEQDLILLQFYGQADIQIRFMSLPTRKEHYYMLILEDILLYNQRLQQNKLASLGRLTASIAHEIRNPLGAISHAGQLLLENAEISHEDHRLVEIIRTNSNRMNQIIEDILMLSRRSASRREKIQLCPWLDHYLKNFHLEHGVNIKVFKLDFPDDALNARIDPAHLKQIMDNLCQNALKYGNPEEGPIQLYCYKNQHMACIDVIDNGPAIRHEHIKHLFEPFFTTSASGTGLGLYISRELAELNQAKLSYYLTKNNRNCFRLLLTEAEHTIIEI
jgi:two-component system sensor histidine kinase PilS (NtrC family)